VRTSMNFANLASFQALEFVAQRASKRVQFSFPVSKLSARNAWHYEPD